MCVANIKDLPAIFYDSVRFHYPLVDKIRHIVDIWRARNILSPEKQAAVEDAISMAINDYSMNRTHDFSVSTAIPNEPADFSVDDAPHSFDFSSSNSLSSSPESVSVQFPFLLHT